MFEATIVGAAVAAHGIAVIARLRTLLDAIAAKRVDSDEHLVRGNGCVVAVFLDLNVIRTGGQIRCCWIRGRINERTSSYAAVIVRRQDGAAIGPAELDDRVRTRRANVVIGRERLHLDIRIRRNREREQVLVITWRNRSADEHGGCERSRRLRAGVIRFHFGLRFNATIRRATIARNEIAVITCFRTFRNSIAAKRVVFHFELVSGNRRGRIVMPHAHVIDAWRKVFRSAIAGNRRVNLGAGADSAIVVAHEDRGAVRSAKFNDRIVARRALPKGRSPRLNAQVRMRGNGDLDVIFIRRRRNATIEDKRHRERPAGRGAPPVRFEFDRITNAWLTGTAEARLGVTSVIAAVAIDSIAVIAFFESNELSVAADCRANARSSRAIESEFERAIRAAAVAAEDVSVVARFAQNGDAVTTDRRAGARTARAAITDFDGARSRTTISVGRIAVVTSFARHDDVVIAIRRADRRHPQIARVAALLRAHRAAAIVARCIAVVARFGARDLPVTAERIHTDGVDADVARAIAVLTASLAKRATRTRSATAIDVGFRAVFHRVHAGCNLTNHAHAHAAVAIARNAATVAIGTSVTGSAAAIDASFSAVLHPV